MSFRSGEFAAWRGLVVRGIINQAANPGWCGITKRCNRYLRRLLINEGKRQSAAIEGTKADPMG